MLTALCSYPLKPGLDRAAAKEDVARTIGAYRGRPGLVSKVVALDYEGGRGLGIYLWQDRASADAYYADVLPMMKQQLGTEPKVEFFDAMMVLDNEADRVTLDGQPWSTRSEA